jgi:hypothetical protein
LAVGKGNSFGIIFFPFVALFSSRGASASLYLSSHDAFYDTWRKYRSKNLGTPAHGRTLICHRGAGSSCGANCKALGLDTTHIGLSRSPYSVSEKMLGSQTSRHSQVTRAIAAKNPSTPPRHLRFLTLCLKIMYGNAKIILRYKTIYDTIIGGGEKHEDVSTEADGIGYWGTLPNFVW